MIELLKDIFYSRHPNGLGARLRRRRHAFFLSLIRSVPRPLTILDIGGTERYWRLLGFSASEQVRITLFNLKPQLVSSPYMKSMTGNAAEMKQFGDQSYEIVFSNSVIEHLEGREAQTRMAGEVMRVGKRYFIQTPNYWFPLEPHFLVPGFQWLPADLRVWAIRHFALGWYPKIPDLAMARSQINHVCLLKKSELSSLFPEACIYEEKILGLTKSFIAYGGWGSTD